MPGMEEAKREAAEFMEVRDMWQFLEGEAEGDALHQFVPDGSEPLYTFGFKRQRDGDFLCLSGYVLALRDGKRDQPTLFVVTAGGGVRERSEKARNEGHYFKSHGLQALTIESADEVFSPASRRAVRGLLFLRHELERYASPTHIFP